MPPPNFVRLAGMIGAKVEDANRAHADSFNRIGDALRVLYPAGVRPDQYDDFCAIVWILEKVFRITVRGADGRDLGGESPYFDICGMGLLGAARDEAKARGTRAAVAANAANDVPIEDPVR